MIQIKKKDIDKKKGYRRQDNNCFYFMHSDYQYININNARNRNQQESYHVWQRQFYFFFSPCFPLQKHCNKQQDQACNTFIDLIYRFAYHIRCQRQNHNAVYQRINHINGKNSQTFSCPFNLIRQKNDKKACHI